MPINCEMYKKEAYNRNHFLFIFYKQVRKTSIGIYDMSKLVRLFNAKVSYFLKSDSMVSSN